MNKIKIMTVILVIVTSLVGCSMEEQSGEVLENKPSAITSKTINLTMMKPETINPITNKNKSIGYIMNLIYDSLFTIDENYDTVPQLVEEYKIENDGMVINIKLKDIKWHDGTILTSSDVKFTVDLIKQHIDSPYNALVENISSISIINNKEFSINFKDKYAFSIDTLIFPIVSEKQLENNNDINNYKNNLVGNGAYKIKSYEERKSLSLIINDSYYNQLPSNAKNIEVEIVPDEEAQVSMVISLDSDIAKISLDDLSQFYEKEFKTTTYESRDYECLLFNYENEVFKDLNFRKAIVSSINKKKILEEGYINNATLVDFPLNSKSKYYDKDIKSLEYSKENAKKYLSQVTFETNKNITNVNENPKDTDKDTVEDVNKSNLKTNNETATKDDKEKDIKEQISKLNLKIIVNKDNSERKKSAYIISENLKDIGIKNTIEELSSEDMSKALNEKNYDLALVGWELSLAPDATNILKSIGYEDERLTNYINSLQNATTESQISDIYKSIQKYVNENALFMSLVIRDDYIVNNRRIEGKISPNSFDIYEGITNLDIAK
ncbi:MULTISPECIES: ABC transporter substrate-binding protein [Romboutsia]|jgi:peptide/nickel transport system substrate-binding protein|uniref:ABC transporter substrate-binding protein n=1 Tax=Romboutsia TaxID=1501226 RepID=UPI00216C747C|nr:MULTISPECIES: ABC transporter substrate-binding protein [Romboutsia]MCI9061679.1 ABC transporter substrate-binding protein [Romboutsia sp.]